MPDENDHTKLFPEIYCWAQCQLTSRSSTGSHLKTISSTVVMLRTNWTQYCLHEKHMLCYWAIALPKKIGLENVLLLLILINGRRQLKRTLQQWWWGENLEKWKKKPNTYMTCSPINFSYCYQCLAKRKQEGNNKIRFCLYVDRKQIVSTLMKMEKNTGIIKQIL